MKHIILIAGGTGGHIFPALAFGDWIKTHRKGVAVSFVCGSRLLEKEIYNAVGINPFFLPLSGSPLAGCGFAESLKRWKEICCSFFVFKKILKTYNIDACVIFGGYISFIPLITSHFRSIPLIVHEQNSVAGKITRIASILGKNIASGWRVCKPLAPEKFLKTGIPVRDFSLKKRTEALKKLKLKINLLEKPIIGVLGGSLMSQRLIQLLGSVLQDKELEAITFLVLSAPDNNLKRACIREGDIIFLEKQWNIENFYSVVDAVVTRGGASTLFELASLGIPAIVVPWRNAANNHQESNARCFLETNDGALWHEDDPPEALKESILRILRNKSKSHKKISEGDESESLWRLISSSVGRETV